MSTKSDKTPGRRIDPYLGYRFKVEIKGIMIAGFSDVSGLNIQTEYERKRFGGVNDRDFVFITGSKYSELVLSHGLIDTELWDWYQEIVNGKIIRKDGTIYLMNGAGEQGLSWHFFQAYPVKWEGPVLNAGGNTVATEKITLVHDRLAKA
ncbi:MAG: phage tail protein [Firmicutes bacterium]|nr:phage tail protein [Bacillota bacterium]